MGSFIKLIKLFFNENNFITGNSSKFTPDSYDFLFVNLGTQVWDGGSSSLLFQNWPTFIPERAREAVSQLPEAALAPYLSF